MHPPDCCISDWGRLWDQRGLKGHAPAPVLILFLGLYLDPTHVNLAVQMPRHTQGAPLPLAHLNKSVFLPPNLFHDYAANNYLELNMEDEIIIQCQIINHYSRPDRAPQL